MKRLLILSALIVLAASPLAAQGGPVGIPLAEVFGGASYYHSSNGTGVNFVGWQSGIDFNVHKNVGVLLDFGGQYKRTGGIHTSLYEYMAGPRFKFRGNKKWTPFLEGLVGGQTLRVPGASRGSFAVGGGGGLDLNVNSIVSIRLIQVDSINARDHVTNGWRNDVRVGAGVVFKFPRQ